MTWAEVLKTLSLGELSVRATNQAPSVRHFRHQNHHISFLQKRPSYFPTGRMEQEKKHHGNEGAGKPHKETALTVLRATLEWY